MNDDGLVTPLDVIILINDINLHGARLLPLPTLDGPPPYLDPDGDDEISASDVLEVVDWIDARVSNKGEGEVSDTALPNALPDRFSLDSSSGTATFALRFPSQTATDPIQASRLDAARISPTSAANAPNARRFADAGARRFCDANSSAGKCTRRSRTGCRRTGGGNLRYCGRRWLGVEQPAIRFRSPVSISGHEVNAHADRRR